jgi:hypothetical protein
MGRARRGVPPPDALDGLLERMQLELRAPVLDVLEPLDGGDPCPLQDTEGGLLALLPPDLAARCRAALQAGLLSTLPPDLAGGKTWTATAY